MDEYNDTAAIAFGGLMGVVGLIVLCYWCCYGRDNNQVVAVQNNPPAQEPVVIPPQFNQTNNNLQANHNDNELQNNNGVLQLNEVPSGFTEIIMNKNNVEVIQNNRKITLTYEQIRK